MLGWVGFQVPEWLGWVGWAGLRGLAPPDDRHDDHDHHHQNKEVGALDIGLCKRIKVALRPYTEEARKDYMRVLICEESFTPHQEHSL